MTDASHLIWFLFAALLLVSATFALTKYFKISVGALPYVAILRAIIQLAFIALVLHGILNFPWAVPAFFAVMLTTASLTSGKHARRLFKGRTAASLGIFAGAALTVTAIFALRMVEFTTQNLIAVGGIIIGGTMTVTTLTARHFISQCKTRSHEIEGWWALGATSPVAFGDIRREAIKEALTPGLDQTKATGLVTLPGTFVGALMGGASPLLAAQLQIAVLAGQTLAGLFSALIFTTIITRSPQLPALEG